MGAECIVDRGRGPEVAGTRITVYNLLTHFLDATATEASICRLYDLTPEQVAAARAYVFAHADTVPAGHLRIEARIAEGNAPEVIAQARESRATLLRFKEWPAQQHKDGAGDRLGAGGRPSFREWLAGQEAKPQGEA